MKKSLMALLIMSPQERGLLLLANLESLGIYWVGFCMDGGVIRRELFSQELA